MGLYCHHCLGFRIDTSTGKVIERCKLKGIVLTDDPHSATNSTVVLRSTDENDPGYCKDFESKLANAV